MSLPRAFMDELRSRVALSDVIGKRVKLTRAGREYKGCCPFHKEKTASFTVNNDKGVYHCFGCGASGDAIGFLMKHDNLAFPDAVEQLAGLAGLQVPQATPEEDRRYKKQAALHDVMERAARWYEARLADSPAAKRYLSGRGLAAETQRGFRLGFADDNGESLRAQLTQAGATDDLLLDSGLFRRSTREGGRLYPFFRNRVMFPVTDLQGRVIAFGGRVMPGADKDAPKYINSPETALFHKGRTLYGLARARKAVGGGETPIVVEGYMDVIALAQAGFGAGVAPLGTALTEQQVQELWKAMPDGALRAPILCFDGDAAGQRAATRVVERMLPVLKPDHTLRFAFLPPEHDPDSLLRREGAPALRRVLDQAIGLFDMLWQIEAQGRDLHAPESKAGFRAALDKRVRAIADLTVQKFFLHEIQARIAQAFLSAPSSAPAVGGRWNKKPLPAGHAPYRPAQVRIDPIRPGARQAERVRILFALMLYYPELYDDCAENLGLIRLDDAAYEALRQDLFECLDTAPTTDSAALCAHLRAGGHGKILDAILDPSLYVHAGFARPGQPLATARAAWADVWETGFAKAARR